MPDEKKKHRLSWFENRIGSFLVRNANTNLFNPPVQIASKQHAKALYLTQNNNHTYSEVKP